MKPIIIIVLLILSYPAICQTFENDWKDFSIKNWIVESSEGSSSIPIIQGVDEVGRITFKNSELNKSITYLIFNITNVNDEFTDELEHWYSIQPCLLSCSLKFFERNNYYYVIKPCDHCGFSYVIEDKEIETPEIDDCNVLMKELSQYKLE